ncbi:NADP-dependent oxidoreductase [Mycolicibacterium moriokaense]|nr:NADP-dependent oxidoreductase [Mycolicibacterium moriokaense]
MSGSNRQIVLAERPEGKLERRHFRSVSSDVTEPAAGEVLCRTVLLSIDPANRAWMQASTYRDQLSGGDVMAGFTLCEVVAGDLSVGTVVVCEAGWQQYAILRVSDVQQVAPRANLGDHLGALGVNGITAYCGLLEVGRPQPGDTVVVSGAAGATGHLVGQLARLAGCVVVGIAGADAKLRVLTDRLGFDEAVSYRSRTFRKDLRAACPRGIDVYFDNVGGAVLEAALPLMNVNGRVVCCGAVSAYDAAAPSSGPRGVPGHLVTKRLRMEGFIASDFRDQWPVAEQRLAGWVDGGQLIAMQDVVDGLDSAPDALIGLLNGDNIGKRIVRVGPDPQRI